MKRTSKTTPGSRRSSRASPRRAPHRAPPAPEAALAAFSRVAAELGAGWYVFGAQAVALYGVQRTSADIDVTIALGEVTSRELVAAAARAGLRARFADDEFVMATRVIPMVHTATGWPLDVVLAGPGLEQLFVASARRLRLGKITVPVIAPEHLVATKLLAGRPKDLEDVRALLAEPELDLDRAALDELLAMIEQALDRSDLRTLLTRLG